MTQKVLNIKDNLTKVKLMLVYPKMLNKVKNHKLGEEICNTCTYKPLRHEQLEKWGNDMNRDFTDVDA